MLVLSKLIINNNRLFLAMPPLFKIQHKDKIFYGNQKKGDLVIMDTKGIHFASTLKKGQRELLWFYY